MPRPLRVFLCHASQDKLIVRELYSALKTEGWIDPWLDKAKILPGQDWRMVIEKAVEDADVVIVCLSNQSVSKEGFVQREIKYAYDIALEKPEETIFLIPLRLDDCAVPRGLRSFHYLDYFGAEKRDAYSDLLEALKLRHKQKTDLEAEEIARKQVEKILQHEADELARKTVAEKAAREKKQRDQMEQDVAEKVALEKVKREAKEKAEREAAEKDAREKKQREQMARDVSEKLALEKVKREAKEKTERQTKWAIGLSTLLIISLSLWGVYKINTQKTTPTQGPIDLPRATEPTAPTNAPPTNPIVGSTWMQAIDGMTLVYVPASEFTMGSNIHSDEQPVHQIYLDAFWIDQTEVTEAMYSKCVDSGKCALLTRADFNLFDGITMMKFS